MAQRIETAKRTINGTWGEVWVDGEKIAECTACQLKIANNKQTVNLCGQYMEDSKGTSGSGTGSLTLYHVDSGFARKQSGIQNGVDRRFTVVSKLADPDSYGAERVAAYNVSFDDLTLADWEAAKLGQIESPFTFNDYQMLDT